MASQPRMQPQYYQKAKSVGGCSGGLHVCIYSKFEQLMLHLSQEPVVLDSGR